MHFPDVEGENLAGEPFAFPRDFVRRTIVLVAFELTSRAAIESWVPFIERYVREGTADGRVFAAIPRGMRMMKGMILTTMRASAPNAAARAVTIPVFVDLDAFCATLAIADRSVIHVYVIEAGGAVLAHQTGGYADDSAALIAASVEVAV